MKGEPEITFIVVLFILILCLFFFTASILFSYYFLEPSKINTNNISKDCSNKSFILIDITEIKTLKQVKGNKDCLFKDIDAELIANHTYFFRFKED